MSIRCVINLYKWQSVRVVLAGGLLSIEKQSCWLYILQSGGWVEHRVD